MRTANGFILKYNFGCSPKYRVFSTMEALKQFVGEFTLKYGQHDDYWVDAVFSGELTLVDRSLEFEYEEPKNTDTGSEPKNGVQRKPRASKDAKRQRA